MKLAKPFLLPTLLAWLLWLAFSIYYGFDRLYGDSAFYLFDVINDLKFSIAHQRPAGYLIEFIPLLMAKNNASMEQIILWFSLNESIVLISLSVLGSLLVKDLRLGMAMMLPVFLGDRYNYFNPVSELILAAPVFILSFGLLISKGDKKCVQFLFLPSVVFIVYSHPLYYVLLPLTYGLLFLLKKVPLIWNIIHGVFILATILFRYYTSDEYDIKQLDEGGQASLSELLLHFSSSHAMGSLLKSFAGLLLLLLVCVFFIYKKERKIISIYGVSVFMALVGLVIYKYNHLFPNTMEPFERYLFPASIFVSLLFYVSSFYNNKYLPWVVTLIIVFQSTQLFSYGKKVKDRNYQLASVIEYAQQHKFSKVNVMYFNFNPTRLGHDWIMTSESLLLSKLIGNKKTVQVSVYESYDKVVYYSKRDNQFVYYPWWLVNVNTLNPEYFNVYEQPTHLLNSISEVANLRQMDPTKLEVKLSESEFKKGKENLRVKCKIENKGDLTILSGIKPNLVKLEYRWIKEGTKPKMGGQVPLLVDIRPGYLNQLILLNTPKEKGTYDLSFCFVINEKTKFALNKINSIQIE